MSDHYILQIRPLLINNWFGLSTDQLNSIEIIDPNNKLTNRSVITIPLSNPLGRVSQLKINYQHPNLLTACFCHSSPVILGWDLRIPHANKLRPSLQLNGQSSNPFISLAHPTYNSSSSHLIAAGSSKEDDSTDCQIECFDLRRVDHPYSIYDQSHSDSITCLEFRPDRSHQLLSASTDGLLVIQDTSIVDQDHSILLTSNTGVSLAHAQFQPSDGQTIWAGSDMETLSRWDTDQLSLLKDYGDLRRTKPDPSWSEPVSYLIGLANPSPTRSAYFAGSPSGHVVLVDTTQVEIDQWTLLGSFNDGHTEMVRCATLDSQSGLVLTGGEDGMVCIWSNDRGNQPSFQLLHRFSPTTTLTPHHPTNLKAPQPSKDNRFKPYSRP